MYKDIFEVSRHEYEIFLSELKPEAKRISNYTKGMYNITEVYSKNTDILLAARESHKNGEEKYYIYELPRAEERLASKPRYTLVLETPEEVQNFINYINKEKQ